MTCLTSHHFCADCHVVVAGLRVSNATFNAIVMRYSDREGHVMFDDFAACMARLKTMFGMYVPVYL